MFLSESWERKRLGRTLSQAILAMAIEAASSNFNRLSRRRCEIRDRAQRVCLSMGRALELILVEVFVWQRPSESSTIAWER